MRRLIPLFGLMFALVLACLAYWSGLSGPMLFDDGPNIIHNDKLAIHELSHESLKEAALSGRSGPLLRPVSMVSFAANHYFSGKLDGYAMKLTNLTIHLVNGAGIFLLALLLLGFYRRRFKQSLSSTQVQWVALAVAAAWLLHPFNLTSVLYVVQRMTSLSALFCIWGLALFLWARIRLYEGKGGILLVLLSLLLFTPLAALSKETGLLLPLFMLLVEIAFFGFHAEKPAARGFLIAFYLCTVALPGVVAISFIAMHPDWLLAGYKIRDFTLGERLMTEARVLWFYLWQILLPSNAQMGLYHDDIAISRGLFNPVNTLWSIVGLGALLGASFVARKKAPIVMFGLLFFLTGHLLESTVWSLEIAHEHRNYLPMFGILLILFFYLLHPLKYPDTLRLRQGVAVMLIGLFAFNTYARASTWSNLYDLFSTEVQNHPASALAQGEMGAIYSKMVFPGPDGFINYEPARKHFDMAASLDARDTKPLFGLIMLHAVVSLPPEPGWLKELRNRLEYSPYHPISSDKLAALTECRLRGVCTLTNDELEGLLQAALRNPMLVGSDRAKVLQALSSCMINVKRDSSTVLAIMNQMVAAAPHEAFFRFKLIEYLTAIGHLEKVKAHLAVLKRMDAVQDYRKEIEAMEATLSARDDSR